MLFGRAKLSAGETVLIHAAGSGVGSAAVQLAKLAGATVIGPILTGVPLPIQICSTNSTVNDILNMAVMAACRVG